MTNIYHCVAWKYQNGHMILLVQFVEALTNEMVIFSVAYHSSFLTAFTDPTST